MEERQAYIDELISVSLSGSLTTEERKTLEAWANESEENRRYLMRHREIWFSALHPQEAAVYDDEKAFAAFKSRVARKKREKTALQMRMGWRNYYKYAVAILVLGIVSYLSYWGGERHVHNALAEVRVEAPVGSQTRLHLPDGTFVILNAGSHITYPQNFGVEARFVKLQGEGYFEVAHNAQMPFRVQAKDLEVRVLGTKFNFRDYPEDHEVVVSLLEGKVGLNNLLREEKEAVLSPDERAVLNKANGLLTVESVTASNASQWTDGYLFFDEELLPDIAKELERSYNVKIHIANDSLKTFRFYGNFVRREQNIQEVLEALASTEKMQYKIEERNITIY